GGAVTASVRSTAVAIATALSARALRRASGSPSARQNCCRCRTFTWFTRCRRQSPTSPTRTRRSSMIYTLPAPIADIAYQNKAVIYDLLFKLSAETTLTIAADPKRLGAKIGITSVLHTWGSAMTHHPHVHMIVPGGGLSPAGSRCMACRPDSF